MRCSLQLHSGGAAGDEVDEEGAEGMLLMLRQEGAEGELLLLQGLPHDRGRLLLLLLPPIERLKVGFKKGMYVCICIYVCMKGGPRRSSRVAPGLGSSFAICECDVWQANRTTKI